MPSNKNKPGAVKRPGVTVNAAALGRAIWQATVLDEKKLVDPQQRQAQWQADRKQYVELGRKVLKQIRTMRRERRAAGEEKK
jgi:hypothetical protein